MPERDAVPLKYLRLHYDRKAMAAEQRGAAPRAQALSELADRAFATYATGDRDSIERVLTERAAPWYEHALAPFLGAVSGEPTDAVFFLTVRNRGYLPWLAADEVVEVPHRFRDGAFVPNPAISAVPEGARAVLDALVAYERNAASAVRTRDPEAIASALADHPWVEAPAAAEALAAAVGSAHANALS
jgi:alpha-galactosidase/6-phospho-beta-glucosidase family protein